MFWGPKKHHIQGINRIGLTKWKKAYTVYHCLEYPAPACALECIVKIMWKSKSYKTSSSNVKAVSKLEHSEADMQIVTMS